MLKAQVRRQIDYSTYDYSPEWRKKEYFLLLATFKEVTQEITNLNFNYYSALVSSGNKFKNDILEKFYEKYRKLLDELAPWTKIEEESSSYIQSNDGRFKSKIINTNEIPPEYAKLVELYRSTVGKPAQDKG